MDAVKQHVFDQGPFARIALSVRRDLPVIAITLFMFQICAIVLATRGISYQPDSLILNAELYIWALGLLGVILLLKALLRNRPASPVGYLFQEYLGNPLFLERIIAGLPILAMQIALLPFFSAIKSAIPTFHFYNWDRTLIALDRQLFFGTDPWRILQPVLGFAPVTAALAVIYVAWLVLNYVGCAWFLYARISDVVRRQFFLCFALSWALIGGVMASAMASFGPAFIGPLTGNSHFIAQMSYLRSANMQIPIVSLNVQNLLLAHFNDSDTGLGSGISAMPSMHVAICMLFYLAVRAISPRHGRWFMAFLILIWVSSVHLAYHYAVDGLVSIVAVAILWIMSGSFIRWWDNKTSSDPRQQTFLTKTVPAE